MNAQNYRSTKEIFAENLRKYRKALGITQEYLGEASGLHRTYIGGIEQGRINPSLDKVNIIANAIGVEPMLMFVTNGSDVIADSLREMCKTSKAKRPRGNRPYKGESENHYALCLWSENDITFLPFDIDSPSVSAEIVETYRKNGLSGNELSESCLSAYEDFRTFMKSL